MSALFTRHSRLKWLAVLAGGWFCACLWLTLSQGSRGASSSVPDPEGLALQVLLATVGGILIFKFWMELRKASERNAELERRQALSETMLCSVPAHIWFLDGPDSYGGANQAHAAFVGVPREALAGKSISSALPDESARHFRKTIAALFDNGAAISSEEWLRDANGRMRLLGITCIPRRDEQGHVVQVVCTASDITEKHLLEKDCSAAKELLQMVMDAIPDPIQYKDPQGRWIYANAACLDVLGVPGDSYVGNTDAELLQGCRPVQCAPISGCMASDEQTWAAGESRRFSESIPRRDGAGVNHFDVLKKPLFNVDGSRKGLVIVCRNINRLVEARAILQRERDTLKAILDAIPFIVFVHDSELRIVECFAQSESDLFVPREAFLGKTVNDVLPASLAGKLTCALAGVARRRRGAQTQYRLEIGGRPRSFVVKIVPYGVDGALSVVEDVTKAKELEHQFKVMKEAIEGSPAVFMVADASGRISYVNQAFCDTTGYQREDVLGKNPRILKSGEHDRDHYTWMWRTLEAGNSWRGEFCNRRSDGTLYWEDAIIVPIRNDSGEISTYVAIKYDITEKKRQALLLEEQRQAAEASSKTKSEFLAMMSHELRTPLNGILGIIQCLREAPLPEDVLGQLDIAEQSGFGLARILSDILYLAGANPETEESTSDFRPDRLVHDIVSMFRARAQEKNLLLDCGNCQISDHKVCCDERKIRYIVFALISNAVKFTESGSVTISCATAADGQGEAMTICVADTGIGISEEQIANIFEPFRQLDCSMTRRFGGVGLGLALAKRFVEHLHGNISVESSLGEGSRFCVVIPVNASLKPETKDESLPAIRRNRSVLYAEDDPINRMAMKSFLSKMDLAIECVENGAEALEISNRQAFDIILMDINMPVMDGIEAMRTIRNRADVATRHDIPIVAVTAYSDEHDRDRLLELGFSAFFPKPLNLKELKKFLAHCLEDPKKEG